MPGAARAAPMPLPTAYRRLLTRGPVDASDMVVASPSATFGLPEAKRGLWAAAGGIPRVVRTFGMQKASDIVLAGRTLSADEAMRLAADMLGP